MIFLSCSNHHHPAGLYIGRVYYVSCTVDTGVGGSVAAPPWTVFCGEIGLLTSTDMAASLWRRLVTCHAHGHANIRDLQPHCEYPHTIQTLLYSVEFHKLYKTPSFIVDSISYTFIHSNLLDIRQFYRGNNNLNILFHGNSIFDTNNMRKIQIDITLAHKILDN